MYDSISDAPVEHVSRTLIVGGEFSLEECTRINLIHLLAAQPRCRISSQIEFITAPSRTISISCQQRRLARESQKPRLTRRRLTG
jgi:hypothetical protein